MTLRPACSDTVTGKPLSSCDHGTQRQLYDKPQIVRPGKFCRGLIVIVMICLSCLWQFDLPDKGAAPTHGSDEHIPLPNLSRYRVRPTQQNTIDPCLAYHGLGKARARTRLTHVLVELCRVARCRFFCAICVWYFALSHQPQAEQRIAKFSAVSTHRLDCHSQCFDPLLRGWTEHLGGGWTVQPLWGQSVTIWKRSWVKLLQSSYSAGRSV